MHLLRAIVLLLLIILAAGGLVALMRTQIRQSGKAAPPSKIKSAQAGREM
jgi:hypothetical protein